MTKTNAIKNAWYVRHNTLLRVTHDHPYLGFNLVHVVLLPFLVKHQSSHLRQLGLPLLHFFKRERLCTFRISRARKMNRGERWVQRISVHRLAKKTERKRTYSNEHKRIHVWPYERRIWTYENEIDEQIVTVSISSYVLSFFGVVGRVIDWLFCSSSAHIFVFDPHFSANEILRMCCVWCGSVIWLPHAFVLLAYLNFTLGLTREGGDATQGFLFQPWTTPIAHRHGQYSTNKGRKHLPPWITRCVIRWVIT